MKLTKRKLPFVAFELCIAVFAGRYAYAQLQQGEGLVAFAYFALSGLGLTCAWIMLQDNFGEPRPPYGSAA
jgi:hypothetical protein